MADRNPLAPRVVVVLIVALAAMLVLRCTSCRGTALRVGTYNIRTFGGEGSETDMERLVANIRESRADVLAVQEIQSIAKARELAARLSEGGRRFELVLSECGGRSAMRVGFLFDSSRVTLRETREYPELRPDGGSCSDGERAAVSVAIDTGNGALIHLLVVHLAAGGEREKLEKRKEQWRRAYAIADTLERSGPVMILGDTNSTGYLDDKYGERTFVDEEAKKEGLEVTTSPLGCSEYFGNPATGLRPSLLDHVVATPSLVAPRSVRVHGFCRDLACEPTGRVPADFETVSDHCPVTVDIAR
ncbi:MAG TPA: endonuclease/exonuclease/phosphatase family protein [Labilithrix sp.]